MKRIISFLKKQVVLSLVVAVVLQPMVPSIIHAETRMGVSATVGGGLIAVSDKDFYGGIPVDLYPEFGMQLDYSVIRLGLKFGFIFRYYQLETFAGYSGFEDEEYFLSYVPIQAEFLIAPLSGKDITPYGGLMFGVFLAVGDINDFQPIQHGSFDVDAGGLIFTIGIGIRFGN